MAGQPKAMASKEPTRLAENSAAAMISGFAPASWIPAATCCAICSVWPVPLQYTTAIFFMMYNASDVRKIFD